MKLDDLSYKYVENEPFISGLSQEVPEGQILSIIGPNGAGKSTLLQLMSGQRQPDSGKVVLNGQSLADLSLKQRAQKIAVVQQQNQVYDRMTVSDVVKTGRAAYHSLLATIPDSEISEFLKTADLTDLADKQITELSGGQQQRVWIAAALAQEPDYLMLDEPTTYLDVHFQKEIMDLIKQLQREKQITVIMVIHNINTAFKVSDQIWMMKAGKLVKAGTASELEDERLLSELFASEMRIVNVPDYGKYVVDINR